MIICLLGKHGGKPEGFSSGMDDFGQSMRFVTF